MALCMISNQETGQHIGAILTCSFTERVGYDKIAGKLENLAVVQKRFRLLQFICGAHSY